MADDEGIIEIKLDGVSEDSNAPKEETTLVVEDKIPEPVSAKIDTSKLTGKEIRTKNRFQKLSNENSYLREKISVYQQALEEKEKAVQEYKERAKANKLAYSQGLEERLDDTAEAVKERLKQAKLEGDVEAEVALTDKLAEIKTDKASLSMLRIHEQDNEDETTFYPDPITEIEEKSYQEPYEEVNPSLEAFFDKNPWADPDSPYFDAQKAKRLDSVSKTLTKQLKDIGQEDRLFTDFYFNILDQAIPKLVDNPVTSNPVVSRGLDVSRNGSSMADVHLQQNSHKIKGAPLTAEQIQMARAIGAVMKNPDGSQWTDKQALESFATNARNYERHTKETPKEDWHIVPLNAYNED